MTERRYLPTFADLCDRLSIVLLKSINVSDCKDIYNKERDELEHDLTSLAADWHPTGKDIRALMVLAIVNATIWQNEKEIRAGLNTLTEEEEAARLRFTHSINGVRQTAKNVLMDFFGHTQRRDVKVDALAADLIEEFGNWRLFEG